MIFLIWVMGGIIFQRGFFNEVVMREFIGRFGETIHRPQPFYFYLPHLLQKFAPWSVLIIALAFFELRSRDWRLRELFRDMSPETFWLLCWSIGGLIVKINALADSLFSTKSARPRRCGNAGFTCAVDGTRFGVNLPGITQSKSSPPLPMPTPAPRIVTFSVLP